MNHYITGTDAVIGAESAVGDIGDTVTDYDYGEKQVIQMRAFYDALGHPAEFKAAVDAVNAAYQNAKAWEPLWKDKVLRWKSATEMKQVGADASKLMAALQRAYPGKASAVPSEGRSAVYDPNAPGLTSVMKYLPWIIGGVVVLGVGIVVVPLVTPLLARLVTRR